YHSQNRRAFRGNGALPICEAAGGVSHDRGRDSFERNQTEGQMSHRHVRILGALGAAVAVVVLAIPIAAQTAKTDAKPAPKTWTPPRAADRPADLPGV